MWPGTLHTYLSWALNTKRLQLLASAQHNAGSFHKLAGLASGHMSNQAGPPTVLQLLQLFLQAAQLALAAAPRAPRRLAVGQHAPQAADLLNGQAGVDQRVIALLLAGAPATLGGRAPSAGGGFGGGRACSRV